VSERGLIGGADSPEIVEEVLRATDEEIAKQARPSRFWNLIGWLLVLAMKIGGLLVVVAAFWTLYLFARLLSRWIGLG
jgi:hypothetical protein